MTAMTDANAPAIYNPNCDVCHGTGEDEIFGGTCSECWGHAPRQGGIGETLRERHSGSGHTRTTPAAPTDDSWKRRPRWTKMPGGDFLVVIPKALRDTAAPGATVQVRKADGAEAPVVLGNYYDRNDYGDDLYYPAPKPAPAPAQDVAAPQRANRFAGTCTNCGGRVAEGVGILGQSAGKWVTSHRPGECPVGADAADTANPAADTNATAIAVLAALTGALDARLRAATGAGTRDGNIRICLPGVAVDVDNSEAAYEVGLAHAGVVRHVGGPGNVAEHPVGVAKATAIVALLLALDDAGLTAVQAAYGQHFHRCGRCGSPLSDDHSKAVGLGPDCAAKGF